MKGKFEHGNENKELLQSCCFESGQSSIYPGFASVFKSKNQKAVVKIQANLVLMVVK